MLLATVRSEMLWLAALGAVNVAISLYYYLLVVKRMYFDPPAVSQPISVNPIAKTALGFLVLGILLIGIVQEPFLSTIALAFNP